MEIKKVMSVRVKPSDVNKIKKDFGSFTDFVQWAISIYYERD